MRLGKVRHESKYLAIRHFYAKKNWSIKWMCRQLEISRAAYYKWLHREVPYEELGNIRLAELIWNETDQYEAIIEAIEALPEAEQTPELISELARAYNNTAGLDDTQNYEKAGNPFCNP